MYEAAGHAVADGVVGLAEVVAMCTINATRAIPKLAPDRGEIAPGKIADLVVSAVNNLGAIEKVYISGRLVCVNGQVKR